MVHQTQKTSRMKKIIALLAFTFFIGASYAQDTKSKQILSKLSEKAKSFTSIKAEFEQSYKSKDGSSTSTGTVYVKDKSFRLNTSAGQDIYSNGETVWTYVKDDQVVYICPIEDALEGEDFSNPEEMFTIWEKDFKSRYVKDETVGGKTYHVIYLSPLKPKEKKFHTIVLKIDVEKMEVYKFIIKGNNGGTTVYKINTFETNTEISDGTFRWTSKPGVDEEEC